MYTKYTSSSSRRPFLDHSILHAGLFPLLPLLVILRLTSSWPDFRVVERRRRRRPWLWDELYSATKRLFVGIERSPRLHDPSFYLRCLVLKAQCNVMPQVYLCGHSVHWKLVVCDVRDVGHDFSFPDINFRPDFSDSTLKSSSIIIMSSMLSEIRTRSSANLRLVSLPP